MVSKDSTEALAGTTVTWPKTGGKPVLTKSPGESEPAFPYLRLLLHFDAASFLSALNEAFEDPFLNGTPETQGEGVREMNTVDGQPSQQKMNRQRIISILWEVLHTDEFTSEQTIYLDMFVARNLPKFPQFILLSGSTLQRVLVELCNYPSTDVAEDCQLSVEYLLSMYRPADLQSLILSFKSARFHRVLKSIFRAEKKYANLLLQYFEDPEDQPEVFLCLDDVLRQRTKLKERQVVEVQRVIVGHAADLISLDTVRTAEIIDRYVPDWHDSFLEASEVNSYSRFIYLQAILEPRSEVSAESVPTNKRPRQAFVEEYVRLMCQYDLTHVAEYVGSLQAGDLRLEQVLPEMENEGVVDAAVMIVAREGQVRDAMARLLKHVGSLEAALLGLLDGDATRGGRHAMQEILDALHKYSRVGIWLCQRQMKSMQLVEFQKKQPGRRSSSLDDDLSLSEVLWLELIEGTVRVAKNATAALGLPAESETAAKAKDANLSIDTSEITKALRSLVQDTFTALLASTTSSIVMKQGDRANQRTAGKMPATQSGSTSSRRLDLSFLRILRAFLARASVTSPSLSELRAVLTSIFSAYTYEESLLSLSNKLLQDDLFVHVEEVTKLRQRGWRPRSQICEGCGRRVWGPGAGGKIWEAWRMKTTERRGRENMQRQEALERDEGLGSSSTGGSRGQSTLDASQSRSRSRPRAKETDKGKGVDTSHGNSRQEHRIPPDARGRTSDNNEPITAQAQAQQSETAEQGNDSSSSFLVFRCQHIFHQSCYERLSAGRSGTATAADNDDGGAGPAQTMARQASASWDGGGGGKGEQEGSQARETLIGRKEGEELRCAICTT